VSRDHNGRDRATRGAIIALGLLLAACQSMSDVKQGDGRKATIAGKAYEQIWDAAYQVSDEHFEIREQNKAQGVILAERTWKPYQPGAWMGIYITSVGPGQDAYAVEVVQRNKNLGTIGATDWEYKVLRDIYRRLGLPALDPTRDR
jgi:hypothetical protein